MQRLHNLYNSKVVNCKGICLKLQNIDYFSNPFSNPSEECLKYISGSKYQKFKTGAFLND